MEYDENPQMTRNQPGIEQKFLKRHPQKSKPTSMQSLNLLFQGQQLHPQSALTSYHRNIEGWRPRGAGDLHFGGRALDLQNGGQPLKQRLMEQMCPWTPRSWENKQKNEARL